MQKKFIEKFGFTLVEVMIVIGVIGIIGGLAIPFYQSFQLSSALENATQEAVQGLRTAQARALSGQNFNSHGIHFDAGQFEIFVGDTYNPADPDNEIFEVASTVSITSSGSSDVVFSIGEGLPSTQPVITLSSSNNKISTLTINSLGVINAN